MTRGVVPTRLECSVEGGAGKGCVYLPKQALRVTEAELPFRDLREPREGKFRRRCQRAAWRLRNAWMGRTCVSRYRLFQEGPDILGVRAYFNPHLMFVARRDGDGTMRSSSVSALSMNISGGSARVASILATGRHCAVDGGADLGDYHSKYASSVLRRSTILEARDAGIRHEDC